MRPPRSPILELGLAAVSIAVTAVAFYFAFFQLPPLAARWYQENNAVVELTGVLPADARNVKPSDGASFLGVNYLPKAPGSRVRVHVSANAYAPAANELVVAVFRSGQLIKVASQPVAARQSVRVELTLDLPVPEPRGIALDLRIGPGAPGAIVFNGSANGVPPQRPTSIEVYEYR